MALLPLCLGLATAGHWGAACPGSRLRSRPSRSYPPPRAEHPLARTAVVCWWRVARAGTTHADGSGDHSCAVGRRVWLAELPADPLTQPAPAAGCHRDGSHLGPLALPDYSVGLRAL